MNVQPVLLFGLLLAFSAAAQQGTSDLSQRAESASGSDCVHLALQAAHNDIEAADHGYAASNDAVARTAIDSAVHDATRAVDCALDSPHMQKKAEIELRKLSRRMTEIARSLEVEERPYVSNAQAEIEKQRDRLLHALFGDAAGHTREKTP